MSDSIRSSEAARLLFSKILRDAGENATGSVQELFGRVAGKMLNAYDSARTYYLNPGDDVQKVIDKAIAAGASIANPWTIIIADGALMPMYESVDCTATGTPLSSAGINLVYAPGAWSALQADNVQSGIPLDVAGVILCADDGGRQFLINDGDLDASENRRVYFGGLVNYMGSVPGVVNPGYYSNGRGITWNLGIISGKLDTQANLDLNRGDIGELVARCGFCLFAHTDTHTVTPTTADLIRREIVEPKLKLSYIGYGAGQIIHGPLTDSGHYIAAGTAVKFTLPHKDTGETVESATMKYADQPANNEVSQANILAAVTQLLVDAGYGTTYQVRVSAGDHTSFNKAMYPYLITIGDGSQAIPDFLQMSVVCTGMGASPNDGVYTITTVAPRNLGICDLFGPSGGWTGEYAFDTQTRVKNRASRMIRRIYGGSRNVTGYNGIRPNVKHGWGFGYPFNFDSSKVANYGPLSTKADIDALGTATSPLLPGRVYFMSTHLLGEVGQAAPMKLDAAMTTGSTTVVVKDNIPAGTPAAGSLIIGFDGSHAIEAVDYTSWTGKTFTLAARSRPVAHSVYWGDSQTSVMLNAGLFKYFIDKLDTLQRAGTIQVITMDKLCNSYPVATTPLIPGGDIASLPSGLANGVFLFDQDSANAANRFAKVGLNAAWLTGTAYTIGQVVRNADVDYLCMASHTAGTFATDLAAGKWSITTKGETYLRLGAQGSLATNMMLRVKPEQVGRMHTLRLKCYSFIDNGFGTLQCSWAGSGTPSRSDRFLDYVTAANKYRHLQKESAEYRALPANGTAVWLTWNIWVPPDFVLGGSLDIIVSKGTAANDCGITFVSFGI